MSQARCKNHGLVDAIWKEGIGKESGKPYGFFACPVKGKDPKTGDWWKCKVDVANTPSGKFEQSLDKSAVQMDNSKKDDTITRLAIVKSMIEAGYKPTLETWKEANQWVDYAMGKSVANMVKAPEPVITAPIASDEIKLEDIPF